jgi:hypothetical protein
MKGIEELIFSIRAGYCFLYCESQEVQKTVSDINKGLDAYFKANPNGIQYQISNWDFEVGGQPVDPDTCFTMLENLDGGYDSVPPGTIVIAKNFNWFLVDQYGESNKEKTSWLLNRAKRFSSPEGRKVLIVVGNVDFDKAIPEILRREFGKIEFSLPTEKEIEALYDFIVGSVRSNKKFKEPDKKTKKRIISGARGLSSSEVIKVLSYSLVKKGELDPQTVEELRGEEINSTPGLKIGKYDKKMEDLKGYEIAKEIVDDWIDDPKAKGIILLGPAGVGKTHFVQSIASYYNRLVIELECAQLMGDGLVGQAEKAWKRALDVIAANANKEAPIIVLIDEMEKGLSGSSGTGGSNDGGTTQRSTSQLLKFLSDARPEGIYIVATCNNIRQLAPEYVRAERWDTAPLFVDLPSKPEQEAILAHYQKGYGLEARPKDMGGWTGAEIKSWCKLARKKLDKGKLASDADDLIVPISRTMSAEIDDLRKWKEGRTVSASRKLIAKKTEATREISL